MVSFKTVSRRGAVWTVAVSALTWAACSSTPILDEHHGRALASNTDKMIANPEAGTLPDDGVTEIEGATVEGTLDRYRTRQDNKPSTSLPQSILLQGLSSSR